MRIMSLEGNVDEVLKMKVGRNGAEEGESKPPFGKPLFLAFP